jgi:predicted RNA methylase
MIEGLDAEPLATKVARHQFVIQVVRTNPPFGTSFRST